jgi:hypothetical protein
MYVFYLFHLFIIFVIVVYLHRIVLTLPARIPPCGCATRSAGRLDSLDNRLAFLRTQYVIQNIVRGFDDFCLDTCLEDKLLAESNT